MLLQLYLVLEAVVQCTEENLVNFSKIRQWEPKLIFSTMNRPFDENMEDEFDISS